MRRLRSEYATLGCDAADVEVSPSVVSNNLAACISEQAVYVLTCTAAWASRKCWRDVDDSWLVEAVAVVMSDVADGIAPTRS
jgi:hypothetical protein